jgi:DNA-binding response OmpR family regulator
VSFILVIENDQDLSKMIVRVLEPSGHTVVTAADGASGLAILRGAIPALVILDLGLPYVSGEEILTYINDEPRLAGVKIVLVTVMDDWKTRHLRPRVERIFQKPYVLSEFREVVEELLIS